MAPERSKHKISIWGGISDFAPTLEDNLGRENVHPYLLDTTGALPVRLAHARIQLQTAELSNTQYSVSGGKKYQYKQN